jgi:hypothetical protein
MHDLNGITQQTRETTGIETSEPRSEVVSTHVLVSEDQVEKLRELSLRTRVAQSEYLREAVDDLLSKYSTVLDTGEEVKR